MEVSRNNTSKSGTAVKTEARGCYNMGKICDWKTFHVGPNFSNK